MNLMELVERHPDLQGNQGDPIFRRSVWAPFFENLHENKVIYRERFVFLAHVDELEIDDKGVRGTVVPIQFLYADPYLVIPTTPWSFGGSWAHMCQFGSGIGQPYAGWTIWPEAARVRAVEVLLAKDDAEGALELLH